MNKKFIIQHDNKEYECYTEISGVRVLSQIVFVVGIGQKTDTALYGDKYHPITTMESTAKIIAREIIRTQIIT